MGTAQTVGTAALVALLAVAAALWVRLCARRPGDAVVVVVGFAVAWAHVLALFHAHGGGAGLTRALIPVKDGLALLLVLTLLVRAFRSGRRPRWLVLPAVLLALMTVPALALGLARHPLSDVALSSRNALVPFVAALTGLLLRPEERRRVVRGAVLVITAGAAYALVEYALPRTFVRDAIGVGSYWTQVKQQPYFMDPLGSGLPGNFTTGSGLRRLSGSFGDPLAAGYVLAAGTVLAALSRQLPRRRTCLVVMAAALVLTLTRGGYLIALGALVPAGLWWLRGQPPRVRAAAGGVVLGAVALGLLVLAPARHYVTALLSGDDSSTRGHVAALLSTGDRHFSLLGDGFGGGGAAVGSGTESVLVTVALQVGVLGLVLYLAALLALAVQARSRWSGAPSLAYAGCWCGVAVTMLISEQLLSFNSGWVLVLAVFLGPWSASPASPGTPVPRPAAGVRAPVERDLRPWQQGRTPSPSSLG